MNKARILVVGSGGREHALGWALVRGGNLVEATPGNPGLAGLGTLHSAAVQDSQGISALVRERGYDLVVIGPEDPLASGLADRLRAEGAMVFGPGADAARLESSKAFAKDFMARHGIPTAGYQVVRSHGEALETLESWGAPVVVKASGLAAGKGVTVAMTMEEAREAVEACFSQGAFGEAGETVVLERFMTGDEASLFVITDGRDYHLLPASQDHKRAFDGDRGPNTGGMGAYSPAPMVTPELMGTVEATIVRPTLDGLRAEGMDYRGVLYVGLMLTDEGPRVVEYNVRFGDPETQVVLPRLGGNLGELLLAAARGSLADADPLPVLHGAAACVVAATADYPRSSAKGLSIRGIEEAEAAGAIVFHAGTALRDGELITSGGRVLNVVGMGATLGDALEVCHRGLGALEFEGMRYRRDIGHRALASRTAPRGDG